MNLSSFLQPSAIKVISEVTSKKRLFQHLSDVAADLIDLPAPQIFEALQDRENLGPTGVGHGVALPHARLTNVSKIHGVFLKLEHPIDFEATDRQPVDLIFALFAPNDTGVDHLKALALVARMFRDPALCMKLRANSDPATLYAVLVDDEPSKAA